MRRIVLDVVVIVAVFLFVGGPTSHASVIYVDDEGGADFATIQEAIDTVVDGDTVLVAPGIYTGEGNRDIDFKGKAITVRSEDGPRTCIIDCQSRGNYFQQNLHRGFHFHSGEDLRSVLDGFMITGGRPPGHDCGGAILCDRAGPRIVNCIIRGNRARKGGGIGILDAAVHLERVAVVSNVAYYGGGIYCRSESADTSRSTFVRCTIAGNYADIDPRFGGEGGGIQLASNADFSNCLIVENRAGYRGGGICSRMNAQSCNLHDSIIWGNERNPGAYGDGHQISAYSCYGSLHIGHSVIQDEIGGDHIYDPRKGVEGHWLSADPCFARPGQWDPNNRPDTWYDDFWVDGDYHLQSRAGRWDPNSESWVQDDVTSPCIDAGNPNSPIGHEPFPNGGVINMGAYGGTLEASKSYFGEPLCETIIAGDINGDCRVDFADLAILTQHWLAHLPSPAPVDEDEDEDQGQTRTR